MLIILFLGYRVYGRFLARQLALDDGHATPAERMNDGVDFVPTRPFYLLGQHFSAIAAAGPIAGPILAAKQFGWGPAVLWIVLGVVLIGAMHDLVALVASVRHEAKSIAEVVRIELGPKAGVAMLAFIWVALVYVIVAFTDVTATTFVQGDPDLAGVHFDFHQGGAVAMAAVLYLTLAVVMGLTDKYLKPPLWLSTVVFVPATLGVVWLGTQLSHVFTFGPAVWAVLILAYCVVASHAPMWLLLQPRGYLGGFILYLAIGAGVVGLFFGGFEVKLPAFSTPLPGPGGAPSLFPFLFVTIACGACSGFHGLVCSGTTSKQIAKESHCHPVGYGAMLMEGFVALVALATVMIASGPELKSPAGTLYGIGLGRFIAVVFGQGSLPLAITFGAMAFSTFVFDTLDVSTRLGRYIVQELFGWKGRVGGYVATLLTAGVPLVFILASERGSYLAFWTLFGTSNQLLAALTLMGACVWLARKGQKMWFVFVPMVFVSAVTLSSLVLQMLAAVDAKASNVARVNGVVSLGLFALAATLLTWGALALVRIRSGRVVAVS